MKEELSKYKADESRQQDPSKLGDLWCIYKTD